MSDLRITFEIECNCGHITIVETEKCDKYICSKCGETVFEKVKDSVEHYRNFKRGNINES